MNKAELIVTAEAIPVPAAEVAAEYAAKREALVARINAIMLARSDLDSLVGPDNHAIVNQPSFFALTEDHAPAG